MKTISHLGISGCLFTALFTQFLLQFMCYGQNTTEVANSTHSEIDFDTLSLFGVTPEFAEQFRLNLIRAIEAAKDEVDPLRQGEFGGVSGGFYQGGGGGGGGFGGGGGGGDEEDEEEEDTSQGPGTPGPGAFGVLSGLFGIFSGLGTLNPSRIIQSTVNFFPPAQRMQAQMIVDSLIGFTPPENRTHRPRPRTRRPPTSPMTITDMMMKEVTEASSVMSANETGKVVPEGSEATMMVEVETASTVDPMAEVIEAASESLTELPTTPPTPGFLNVHELLDRSTSPLPTKNEDDENDFEIKQHSTTVRAKSNSSMSVYKVKVRQPSPNANTNEALEIRGVTEDDLMTNLNASEPEATTTLTQTDSSLDSISSTELPVPSTTSTLGNANSSAV